MTSLISPRIPLSILFVINSIFAWWLLFGAGNMLEVYGAGVAEWNNMERILNITFMLINCGLLFAQIAVYSAAIQVGNSATQSWILLFVGLCIPVTLLEGVYTLYFCPWADQIHMNGRGSTLFMWGLNVIVAVVCLAGVDKSSLKRAAFSKDPVYWAYYFGMVAWGMYAICFRIAMVQMWAAYDITKQGVRNDPWYLARFTAVGTGQLMTLQFLLALALVMAGQRISLFAVARAWAMVVALNIGLFIGLSYAMEFAGNAKWGTLTRYNQILNIVFIVLCYWPVIKEDTHLETVFIKREVDPSGDAHESFMAGRPTLLRGEGPAGAIK